jgi:predicted dehydrogenase
MDKVRCAVIGVGAMGSDHCRNINEDISEVELTAVCDTNPDALLPIAEKFSVPGFATHQELLESGLVDMVIIATPHYFHPPIAIDAFKKGLHVISEKPIAVTVSDADAMIKAAKEADKIFGVMHQMRSSPRLRAVKKMIQDGLIGEINRTNMIFPSFRCQAYYNSQEWRATWTGEGGGILINQAPHALDLLTWWGGLPSRVTGFTRTRLHDIEVEDEAWALLEYSNGAIGYLYASTTEEPYDLEIDICGDRGRVKDDNSGLKFLQCKESISEFNKNAKGMWDGIGADPIPLELPKDPEGTLEGHAGIIQNCARAIKDKETPLFSPGEDGLAVVEMINAITLSSRRNKPVDVPVNRAEYDELMDELKATSKHKTTVSVQRVTDPKYAPKS